MFDKKMNELNKELGPDVLVTHNESSFYFVVKGCGTVAEVEGNEAWVDEKVLKESTAYNKVMKAIKEMADKINYAR